jgi:hypothetical protein
MIKIIDKNGVVVAEVSEKVFPLRLPVETEIGGVVYKLYVTFKETDNVVKVRTMNLGK